MKGKLFLFIIALFASVSCSKNDTSKQEVKPKKVKYEVFMSDYSEGNIVIAYASSNQDETKVYVLKEGKFSYETEVIGNFSAYIQTHIKDANGDLVITPKIERTMKIYLDNKVVAEKITKETFDHLDYFVPIK
ncbi:hypothetical protein [Capnocytophaga canimorsus]|uniref:hypothetical protein n=1 Tax=Capnocytophaga canimorsus TaxID=28188 RepID=UPI001AC8B377|nr:hypothetical protein [Capnocytophaga canimorsus]GIM59586.1 hypothetical protein CAPN007_17950 [Capnocytophaga canimorsus]